MRADRLLSVLLLLQAHARLSAADLARRLEVSERTILRDIDTLSSAGVPVYTERGRHGGCALLPGYRTDVSGLTAAEARALFVFGGGGAGGQLGMEPDLRAALRKLMSALPEAQRPQAIRAQERVVVDPRGWMRGAEKVPWLEAIQEAVWADRRLRLRYRRAGAASPRTQVVDPYGLVFKAGVWYLIAAVEGEARMYRVSRVESVQPLDEAARRPSGLDLEALWNELRGRLEERGAGVEVMLLVPEDLAEMVLRVSASQLVSPAEREGPGLLRLRFAALGAARGALLGFGPRLEVLSPPELRRDFAEVARALVELYAGGA